MDFFKKKYGEKILQLTLPSKEQLSVGGESSMPLYGAPLPNILIAHEITVLSEVVQDWYLDCVEIIGNSLSDPVKWAEKLISEFHAAAICINLSPLKNLSIPLEEVIDRTVRAISAIDSLIIVKGCSSAAIDNKILPAIAKSVTEKQIVIAPVLQENCREIMEPALQHGHLLVAESPIDINIAKQLNMMLLDYGFPADRILIDPTTGGPGYGLEYTLSIMERARLAALGGDTTLAMPFINFVGQEAWRAKEARESGMIWEASAALPLILAGSDFLVMRHPKAVVQVEKYIDSLEL